MASADEQSRVLEGELTCPVCMDIFENPHMLPCGHNFCLVCVKRLKSQTTERGRYRCPDCRQSHRCNTALLKNYKLANIASNFQKKDAREEGAAGGGPAPGSSRCQAKNPVAVPCDYCPPWTSQEAGDGGAGASTSAASGATGALAVKTCLKCEVSMCQEHVKPHLELAAFREHPLTEPQAELRKRKCPEHDEMYRYYCLDDKVCVCNACTIEGHHTGHTIKTLKNTMTDLKRPIERQLHMAESKLTKADEIFQELKEEEGHIKKFQDDSVQRFTELRLSLVREVDDFLDTLRECTSEHCATVGPSIQENLTKVSQDQARLRELRNGIQVLLQENDPFLFLEVHKSSTKRHCSQLKKRLFSPNFWSMETDTLGNNMEAKMEVFMSVLRDDISDAIESLCPSRNEAALLDSITEEEEYGDDSQNDEEEMPSEGEEETEEEEDIHDQTGLADEDDDDDDDEGEEEELGEEEEEEELGEEEELEEEEGEEGEGEGEEGEEGEGEEDEDEWGVID